jgi:hypothetical protein
MNAKQIESVREGLRRNVRMGADLGNAQATADALLALLRRDWAVRVLDAWVANETDQSFNHCWSCDGTNSVSLAESEPMSPEDLNRCGQLSGTVDAHRDFRENTPDAARHAAALAVWPELTHEQCQEIGPCP